MILALASLMAATAGPTLGLASPLQPALGQNGQSFTAGTTPTPDRPSPSGKPGPPESKPSGGFSQFYYTVHFGGGAGGTGTGYKEDFMVFAPDQS
jgi:hypothetical protein